MDVRDGLWRRLSAEELILLNCGVGEDSWESFRLQGDPTCPFWEFSPGISLKGMMLKLKLQYFGHLMWRDDSLEKTDAGRDWRQEEKGMTEDEMAGWHRWLNRRESEWTPGVGDGQGGLVCCDSWGHKKLNMAEWLNWTELKRWWRTENLDMLQFMGVAKSWTRLSDWTELNWRIFGHFSACPLSKRVILQCYSKPIVFF